eukprot:1146932-Pelagomonas_calceolata.AAC.3
MQPASAKWAALAAPAHEHSLAARAAPVPVPAPRERAASVVGGACAAAATFAAACWVQAMRSSHKASTRCTDSMEVATWVSSRPADAGAEAEVFERALDTHVLERKRLANANLCGAHPDFLPEGLLQQT